MLAPIYEREQDYPCIQAADCLAYESRRFVDAATSDVPPDSPRRAFLRLMEHVRTAFYLDYDALKRLAALQPQPDVLPVEPTIDNRGKSKRLPR